MGLSSAKQASNRPAISWARSRYMPTIVNRQLSPWLIVVSAAPLNRCTSAMMSCRKVTELSANSRPALRSMTLRYSRFSRSQVSVVI